MESKIQLLRPRRLGELISDTLGFIKLNFKPLGQVLIFLVLPILVVGAFFFSQYFVAVFSAVGSQDPAAVAKNIMGAAGSIFLGYLGLIIASFCLNLSVVQIFLIYEKSEDGVITFSEVFNGIKSNFLRFTGYHLALGFIFGLIFVVLILLIAGVGKANFGGLAAFLGFAMVIGFMYAAIGIVFSPFIYMREHNGFFNSISRSFYLIKGNWWRTFGTILVMYFIAYIVALIFMVPFMVSFFASSFHSLSGDTPKFEMSQWSSVAFVFMICGMTIVFSSIYFAIILQYYSLLEKKDGEGVLQQIENIGTDAPTNA